MSLSDAWQQKAQDQMSIASWRDNGNFSLVELLFGKFYVHANDQSMKL